MLIQNMEEITMTDLKFDEKTAETLVRTAPKMKPLGVSRAYMVNVSFSIGENEFKPGDYIVLSPDGKVRGELREFVDAHFEPVAKRTRAVKS